MEPAVFQRLFRGFLLVPVAFHDGWPFDEQLTRHAARQFLAVGVGDDDLDAVEGRPDGAGTVVARCVHRDDGRGLGETVAFVYEQLEFLHVSRGDFLRQRRTADDGQAQALQILLGGLARQDGTDGRHDVHGRDLLLADGADRLLGHEAVDDDDGAAGAERRENGARPGEAVVHRQHA